MYFFSCCFRYSAPIYPILYILYEILDILWRITFSLPDIHIWKSCNEHRLQMILSPFVLKCHEFWIGLYRCFQVHEINTHWIACDTAKVRSYFLSFIVASLKPTVSPCATQWRKSVSLYCLTFMFTVFSVMYRSMNCYLIYLPWGRKCGMVYYQVWEIFSHYCGAYYLYAVRSPLFFLDPLYSLQPDPLSHFMFGSFVCFMVNNTFVPIFWYINF